jgi:glycosyltransferase involved in cell wall biosynthesis
MAPGGLDVHVVGEGADRVRLAEQAAQAGWSHVMFDPPVAAPDLPVLLAAADAIVVLLRRGWLYEHSLPTKLVEGLAAGRPMIVSADGDAARIVVDAEAGFAAPAEDADALKAAIRATMASTGRADLGRRALEASAVYDRAVIVRQLEADLFEIARRHPSPRAAEERDV